MSSSVITATDANDRVDRAAARLGSSDAAARWLASIGLQHAMARRLGLGLESEDDRGLAIAQSCFDRRGEARTVRHLVDGDGRMRSRVAGAPTGVWSAPPVPGGHVLVLPSLPAMWRLQAAVGIDLGPFVAVAPSHDGGVPMEWPEASHWRSFSAVTTLLDDALAGGALLATVGAAAGAIAAVATAPGGNGWSAALVRPGGFGAGDLLEAVEDALPVALFLHAATDAERVQREGVDVHAPDRDGRLMRVIRVEERVPTSSGEKVRCRDLVVRSDGMLLEVSTAPAPPGTPVRDRLVTLADGTRLTRAPAATCEWSLASVRRFVSGTGGLDVSAEGDALLAAAADAVRAMCGLDGAAVEVAAAFVMMSHVHRLFDELRVPVFHGGTPGGRARLVGIVARLCHGGAVHSRARSDVLATTACELGGAILLDEPGPLAGPGGPTEAGRFVLASSFAQAIWDRTSGSGERNVSVFGPRAIFSHRAPGSSLQGIEMPVALDQSSEARCLLDDVGVRELLDRLYVWSMQVHRVVTRDGQAWSGRCRDAIAALTTGGSKTCIDNGDRDPAPPPAMDAEQIIAEAFAACAVGGQGALSITHLMMEAALRGGTGPEFSPERVGRWLASSGLLAPGVPVQRRRLHGHISRIYDLDLGPEQADGPRDPFDFCMSTSCRDCRYRTVCEAVAPGMLACKARKG